MISKSALFLSVASLVGLLLIWGSSLQGSHTPASQYQAPLDAPPLSPPKEQSSWNWRSQTRQIPAHVETDEAGTEGALAGGAHQMDSTEGADESHDAPLQPNSDWEKFLQDIENPQPTPVSPTPVQSALQRKVTTQITVPPEKESNRLYGSTTRSSSGLLDDLADELLGQDETNKEELSAGVPRWVDGQARGYTILSLMQPEARASAEAMIENLLASRLRSVYLGVLVDGTFGWSPGYLTDVVRRLNSDGRTLTLVLYIVNGATMRNHESTVIDAAFTQVNPLIFRDLIRFDPSTRGEFIALASRIRPVLQLNKGLNSENRNITMVMLEDNLDRESYRATRDLATNILSGVSEVGRNPCLGCFEGNDTSVGPEPLEVHQLDELRLLRPGDGYSLDGLGYYFSTDSDQRGLDEATMHTLLDATRDAGIAYIGLWRFDRQGLGADKRERPDERSYAIPTPTQLEKERELLRYGLPSEE